MSVWERFKSYNDKFGIIILFAAYGVAGWIWYETIKNYKKTEAVKSLESMSDILQNFIEILNRNSSGSMYAVYHTAAEQLNSLLSDLMLTFKIVGIAVLISIIVSNIYIWRLSKKQFRKTLRKKAAFCLGLSGLIIATCLIYQAQYVQGQVIIYTQYIYGFLTAAFATFVSLYSVCYKTKNERNRDKARNILDLSSKRANKIRCVLFIPLLFITLVIIWWLAFTYLFYAIYITYTVNHWYFWFHIFMGLYVLNGIYLFSCLSIAVYICKSCGDYEAVKGPHDDNVQQTDATFCLLFSSMLTVSSTLLGSIGKESLWLIWCAPLTKIRGMLVVLGKLLLKASNVGEEDADDLNTDVKKRNCCVKCTDFMTCCFFAPFRCLAKCIGCLFYKLMARCMKNVCCSGLVDINTICYQAKYHHKSHKMSMCRAYKSVKKIIGDENKLEDNVDQIVDWAMYVSEIWIPFFTSALCLIIIVLDVKLYNVFKINEINSILSPAFVSLLIGIIIGNLYLSVYRVAAHVVFVEEMEKEKHKNSRDGVAAHCCCLFIC